MTLEKRSQDQMLEKEGFLPTFNSTFFVDIEDKECAKIIHDIVFQKFGNQRKLYRSKRLKVLRKNFYPDVIDESGSSYKIDKVNNFQDVIKNKDDDNTMKIISKNESTNAQPGLDRSKIFSVRDSDELLEDNKEMQGNFLKNLIEIPQRQMNLTYTEKAGSEDISVLLSEKSINPRNPSKSINDDNNNTVIEESNETDKDIKENVLNCIDAQDIAIEEFQNVLLFGKRKRGFSGSIPHIQAEKGLLVANLRKQVLSASLNNKYDCPSIQKESAKGKITIDNIKCDTNVLIEDNHGILPCYYLCIVQHKTTVLCTDILAPDKYGIVEFSCRLVFENITNTFLIKLMLFKLQLTPTTDIGWRVSLRRRQFELPKLLLVGNQIISIRNLNKTAFSFDNEILYANFTACINMSNRKEANLRIQKLVRKSKSETKLVSHKRWCVLEGTDLKVYRCRSDVEYSKPMEVISLVYCKSCEPYYLTPRTLLLDFVYTFFGRTLYLAFEDKDAFRDWLNLVNKAIVTAKNFGL